MKTKKIIEVLKFMKDYCAKNRTCWDCYFYNQDCECCILNNDMPFPALWDIENIESNLKGIEEL